MFSRGSCQNPGWSKAPWSKARLVKSPIVKSPNHTSKFQNKFMGYLCSYLCNQVIIDMYNYRKLFHKILISESLPSDAVSNALKCLYKCVVAVEVANYNMRHVSASKWREQELFSWWLVRGMYHYTGYLHCNELNIILFTYRNAVNLQTISNKQRASMFVVWTFSYYCHTRNAWPCLIFGSVGFLET